MVPGWENSMNLDRFISTTAAVNFIIILMTYGLQCFTHVFLANIYTTPTYGTISLAWRILSIASAIALFGAVGSIIKYGAETLASRDLFNSFAAWLFRFTRFKVLLLFLIPVLSYAALHFIGAPGPGESARYIAVASILLVVPFFSVARLSSSILDSTGHSVHASLLGCFAQYGVIIASFWVLSSVSSSMHGYSSFVAVMLFAYGVYALVSLGYVFRLTPLSVRTMAGPSSVTDAAGWTRQWKGMAYLSFPNNLIFLLTIGIDQIVVALFDLHEGALGHYSAAMVLASFPLIISQSVYKEFRPKISRLVKSEDTRQELQHALAPVNRLMAIITILAFVVIYQLSPTILSHFGPGYLDARTTAIVLLVSYCIRVFSSPAAFLLNFSRHAKLLLVINASQLVVLIVFSVWWTYAYGIIGTAYANLLASVYRAVAVIIAARVKVGVKPLSLA